MTVFLAINSKFTHTLLSVRYLKQYVKDSVIYETNINVSKQKVLADLYKLNPKTIGISCYIFNIEYVKSIIEDIKILLPQVKIILGGYGADSVPYFDKLSIVYGEGENSILNAIQGNKKEYYAPLIPCLDDIISPYDEEYISMGKTKIIYFESSRGCPFNCSYCMSAGQRVRYFSLERVFSDLKKIASGNVMQVKFVDRTFNANIDRACEIFDFIISNFSHLKTNFHFEMAPELFNDKMFQILQTAPKGLLQFEIGVQSFNKKTLESCNRKCDALKITENIKRTINLKNIHVHTDLIAGLPYEDYDSFKISFNKLYALKSDLLQLGFLKLLPNSELADKAEEYGYISYKTAPYEIIKSNWLDFSQILRLKTAESALDRYYNSGNFKLSLDFIMQSISSPYDFYSDFGAFLLANGAFEGGISAMRSADLLFEFGKKFVDAEQLVELINADYQASGNIRKWKRVYRG